MTDNLTKYALTTTNVFVEDIGNITTYGLKTINLSNNITINDISITLNKVQNFINLCNKNNVSILTLNDLIEDYFF